ncbi:MAG: GntR family transcriptional regulator [Actinomycetota bacterium]
MSARDFSEVEVPLIQEVVLDQLRERLVDGTFPPGAHLNISEIADALGVSIVPVREAVKILQSEGRLIRDRNRSYRVRRLTKEELAQMNQLSSYLEIELIRAGVPNLTDHDVEKMREMNDVVVHRKGDRRQVLGAHRELHFICYRAAAKSVFLDYVSRLWDHYEHYRLLFFDSDVPVEGDASVEHQEFVEACAARDAEAALEIHERHRANSFVHLSRLADEMEEG